MNPFKGKTVIVADMDGTLTPSREEISDEMVQAIKELLYYNYKFAILGGGTLELFERQILNKLELVLNSNMLSNLFILPCSGTKMYQIVDKKVNLKKIFEQECNIYTQVYTEELSPLERIQIKKVIDKFREEFREKLTWGNSYDDRGSQITLPILGLDAPLELKKQFDPDKKIRLRYAKWLKNKLPWCEITVGGTSSIDITRKGLNKAYGITNLCEHINCFYHQVIFFGDAIEKGGNDYPVKKLVDTIAVKDDKETLRYFKKELRRK